MCTITICCARTRVQSDATPEDRSRRAIATSKRVSGWGDSWLQPRNRGGEGGRERAQASEAFAAGGGRRAAWIVWAAMPRVRAAQRFGLPCRHLCRQTSSRCAPCVPRSHTVSKLRAHAETRVHVTSDVRGTFVYRQVCSHALDMLMCAFFMRCWRLQQPLLSFFAAR